MVVFYNNKINIQWEEERERNLTKTHALHKRISKKNEAMVESRKTKALFNGAHEACVISAVVKLERKWKMGETEAMEIWNALRSCELESQQQFVIRSLPLAAALGRVRSWQRSTSAARQSEKETKLTKQKPLKVKQMSTEKLRESRKNITVSNILLSHRTQEGNTSDYWSSHPWHMSI